MSEFKREEIRLTNTWRAAMSDHHCYKPDNHSDNFTEFEIALKQKLKRIRKKNNCSRKLLAKMLGVNLYKIDRIEATNKSGTHVLVEDIHGYSQAFDLDMGIFSE